MLPEGIDFISQLNRLLEDQPFRSFVVRVAGGGCYRVDNPFQLAVYSSLVEFTGLLGDDAFFPPYQIGSVEIIVEPLDQKA